MYPYDIIFGIDLYEILLTVGIISAMLVLKLYSDKKHYDAKFHNFLLLCTASAIILGYGSAVLFQAFYNMLDGEGFHLAVNTGATFYGGLIGGVAVFIGIYFIGGRFAFKDSRHIRAFLPEITEMASVTITVAHGFGRLGCLMAGCCHGAPTDAWYGIYHVGLGTKVVPVQLFEAVFLFALSALLIYRITREKRGNMPIYMLTYGTWRFFIEYARTDDRGATVIPGLTPSQLVALLMVAGGLVFAYFYLIRPKRSHSDG